jgi:hypothetical protein
MPRWLLSLSSFPWAALNGMFSPDLLKAIEELVDGRFPNAFSPHLGHLGNVANYAKQYFLR